MCIVKDLNRAFKAKRALPEGSLCGEGAFNFRFRQMETTSH